MPFNNIIRYECVLFVLLAIIVSLISYALIILQLFGRRKANAHLHSSQRRKEKIRALCVIATAFSIFLSCWLPSLYIILWQTQLITEKPIIVSLPRFEIALNPILYMVTMPVFRPPCFRKVSVVAPYVDQSHTEDSVPECQRAEVGCLKRASRSPRRCTSQQSHRLQ